MAVRLGLVIPIIEVPAEGRAVPWADIRDMARAAEDVGFESVWLPDELLWDVDDGPMGFWECTSMLSALAATTSRIEIGTSVLCVTYRNPALVAKIATTVDEISGGRFVLGLGAGYPKAVHTAFGYPNDHQYGRFEEALTIITDLLRHGRADFVGKYHRAENAELRPRYRPEGPPILIAAGKPKMQRLAAQYADRWNWFSFDDVTPEHFAPLLSDLDTACREVGRDPNSLERTLDILVAPTGQTDTLPFGQPILGSSDEIAEIFSLLANIGVSEIRAAVWPPSPTAVEAMAPVIELLAR